MRVCLLSLSFALAACGGMSGSSDQPTPARIETAIAPQPLVAGDTATVTCTVYDTAGDVIDGAQPTLIIVPDDPGTTVSGIKLAISRAGLYSVQCVLPELQGDSARFDVVHAPAAKLAIGRVPDRKIYPINSVIAITHLVTDRFGNPIPDATVAMSSAPVLGVGPTSTPSPTSFSYGSEGRYRVAAQVTSPTQDTTPVTASLDIVVNQSGPMITCGSPADGTMLDIAAGAPLTFTGTASDLNDTMSVTVNGTQVSVSRSGAFSAPITARFGINFVEVVATDGFGVETAKICTFLAASQWASPTDGYRDTLSLRLNQAAIDDGDRNGGIDSFGDILFAVANSEGLYAALDHSLTSANPLKAPACDRQLCTFLGCICYFRSGIEYRRLRIDGPNTNGLSLVSDGIAATAQINGIHIELRIGGSAGPFPFDTTGDVDISHLSVAVTLDPSAVDGRPHISLRPGSVSTSVGAVATNFDGIDGWLINNIVVPLAQGPLRSAMSARVEEFVTGNFNGVLDGIVSNLDVANLGANIHVPRLDSGSVALQLGLGLSTLSTAPHRLLFGLATQFTAPSANGFASRGIAIPGGPVLGDPETAQRAAITAHVGLLNQAFHALWKADYFALSIDGGTLDPEAAGFMLRVTTRLPPVASFSKSNQIELALGAIDVAVDAPSIPLHATIALGARAHTAVTLVGDALRFSNIVIDEVYFSSDSLSLSEMRQMQLETHLQQLAQKLIDTSLNNALPALPIPRFAIPASLAQYGIPMGHLGIDAPSFAVAPPHFRLGGSLSIR